MKYYFVGAYLKFSFPEERFHEFQNMRKISQLSEFQNIDVFPQWGRSSITPGN